MAPPVFVFINQTKLRFQANHLSFDLIVPILHMQRRQMLDGQMQSIQLILIIIQLTIT